MKKENLIWLAVGGLAVYFIFFRKRTATQATSSATKPTPAPPLDKEIKSGGVSGMKPPSLWTDEELIEYHNKFLCYGMRGYNEPRIAMTKVRNYTNNAVAEEIKTRKLITPPCHKTRTLKS